jgi:hypothetical protein
MIIDEALAKGLAKQFILSCNEGVEKSFKKMFTLAHDKDYASRNGREKIIVLFDTLFKKHSLSNTLAGSKRHPYIGYVLICGLHDKNYCNWSEDALSSVKFVHNLMDRSQGTIHDFSSFYIGVHCISRLFQRSNLITSLNFIDYGPILSEMSLIPLWSNFWELLFSDLKNIYEVDISIVTPMVPSANGLFFCKQSEINGMQNLEVRTYVHKSKLTETQNKVREVLLIASKNFESSALSLYPCLTLFPASSLNDLELARTVIFHRIRNITFEVSSLFLRKKSDFDIYKLDKFLKEIINKRTSATPHELEITSDYINSVGYRTFMNEANSVREM